MLKRGKTEPCTAQQPEVKPKKSHKWIPMTQKTPKGANLAVDSNGQVHCDMRQVRIKSMQQELLQLVKAAEKGGRVRVLRRKETESISMPGHGIVRLAPPARDSVAPPSTHVNVDASAHRIRGKSDPVFLPQSSTSPLSEAARALFPPYCNHFWQCSTFFAIRSHPLSLRRLGLHQPLRGVTTVGFCSLLTNASSIPERQNSH
eukprot:919377-Rhodomonas_salina.1